MQMARIPSDLKIYHITHIRNLKRIIADQTIWSDAKRIAQNCTCELIGLDTIKKRRLEELEVKCNPGTKVGEYVPFYFCPRSIMLYIFHANNHPDLKYHEGQSPIVHLQANFNDTIAWAKENGKQWAFSASNAGARYTDFYNHKKDLNKLNWPAIQSIDFRSHEIREGKQAEFLLYETFPWELIEKIGVIDNAMLAKTKAIVKSQQPLVAVEPTWYY